VANAMIKASRSIDYGVGGNLKTLDEYCRVMEERRWVLPHGRGLPRCTESLLRKAEERGVRNLAVARSDLTNRGDITSDNRVADVRVRVRDGKVVASGSGETGVRLLFIQRTILEGRTGEGRERA
jgi:hypothetical protein